MLINNNNKKHYEAAIQCSFCTHLELYKNAKSKKKWISLIVVWRVVVNVYKHFYITFAAIRREMRANGKEKVILFA